MTAQVAVLNRFGVGLAADSAVTIGPSNKIFTSADKMFQLSERAPVGIMVYGYADYLDVPWETIVKMYRKRLQKRVFDTIDEYAADFLAYLKGERRLFSAYEQKRFVSREARRVLEDLDERFGDAVAEQSRKGTIRGPEDFPGLLKGILEADVKGLQALAPLDGLPADFDERFEAEYGKLLPAAMDKVFPQINEDVAVATVMKQMLVEFFRRGGEAGTVSGVVIAGFGEVQHFPAIHETKIRGMILDIPCVLSSVYERIGPDGKLSAKVFPFAQREMVDVFMQGIDPGMREELKRRTTLRVKSSLGNMVATAKALDATVGAAVESQAAKELREFFKDFIGELRDLMKEAYSDPIMSIVETLPKEELGSTAEALVNLTKFKRRVSAQTESVGGPIDVVVITKGDGLVWVKRKHYFRAEENVRVIGRQLLGGLDQGRVGGEGGV